MSVQQSIAEIIAALDAFGFDVGSYRVSAYRALLVVVVGLVLIAIGRTLTLIVRHSFRKMKGLDAAQQLLGEKIISLLLWVGLFLAGIDFLGISLTALTVFSGALGPRSALACRRPSAT